jgi:hypothetical protein
MKIGYWPLSDNLQTAGDRRRVVFWAQARGYEIVTDLSQKVDVIVASEKSDFNSQIFAKAKVPIIFDLVDAYLSPRNALDDLARGLAHGISGQVSGQFKPFSDHIKSFCLNVNAVICSSLEQEQVIKPFNLNTHIILDSHEEIPFIDRNFHQHTIGEERRIMWEGQPATIRGVQQIHSALQQLTQHRSLRFNFVTDERYFRILGKFMRGKTLNLLQKDLDKISDSVSIIPWSLDNLIAAAQGSSLGIIPIDLSVPMQKLKPENRLLIMWRLGLPCLTSPSPAYVRVSNLAGVGAICTDEESWLTSFQHLLDDPKFSFAEIERGQNYLREHHTRTILLDKWDRAIESVLS